MRSTKENSIIPKPQIARPLEGTFSLTDETLILYSPEAQSVSAYLAGLLRPSTTYPFPLQELTEATSTNAIILSLSTAANQSAEEYSLAVTPENIQITAPTAQGLFYGVQSLRQLLPPEIEMDKPAESVAWTVPALAIEDAPRFQWRGLHLDVGRHFYPVPFIKKFIDLLALHKYNIFHWHLTEDQGWRIEIKKYPRLTEVGAFRKSTPIPADRTQTTTSPTAAFTPRKKYAKSSPTPPNAL